MLCPGYAGCDNLGNLLLVDVNGHDDASGRLTLAPVAGSPVPKSLRTISAALALATAQSTILLLPGVYTNTCNVDILHSVRIVASDASNPPVIDCAHQHRFATISNSNVSVRGPRAVLCRTSPAPAGFWDHYPQRVRCR